MVQELREVDVLRVDAQTGGLEERIGEGDEVGIEAGPVLMDSPDPVIHASGPEDEAVLGGNVGYRAHARHEGVDVVPGDVGAHDLVERVGPVDPGCADGDPVGCVADVQETLIDVGPVQVGASDPARALS